MQRPSLIRNNDRRHRVESDQDMRVIKQFWFDNNTRDLLERILEGGIVVCPESRLQIMESGVRERKVVVDRNLDGIRRAA